TRGSSDLHACMLAGVRPVYLGTRVDEKSGLDQGIDPEILAEALERFPEAKAVVVTSPSYHGVVQPIDRFADLCHARGIPLIVDEAHGAHFGFHPSDRKSTRLNSSHVKISYAVFCLKKQNKILINTLYTLMNY